MTRNVHCYLTASNSTCPAKVHLNFFYCASRSSPGHRTIGASTILSSLHHLTSHKHVYLPAHPKHNPCASFARTPHAVFMLCPRQFTVHTHFALLHLMLRGRRLADVLGFEVQTLPTTAPCRWWGVVGVGSRDARYDQRGISLFAVLLIDRDTV